MDPSSVPEQSIHPNLSLAKVQKLETLGLHYNSPEEAIICTKCGFALSPKRASEHPGKKHGIARSARHGLKHLLSSLNLPDPDTLAPRPNGSRRHPYLTVQEGLSCKHCGLHSASGKVLEDHLRAEHRDKLKLTAGKKSRQHWLRDHIQQGVLFQSWTANNTRRSWLVSNDNDINSRSIPSSFLLQARPDPVKLLAQKLFNEEHVRLESQQSGGQRSCGKETPASSALQTNWLRRMGWETTFRDAHRDILVRLTVVPQCTDNRPLLLGVVKEEAMISPAHDERRILFMMAALDHLLDHCGETVRKTDDNIPIFDGSGRLGPAEVFDAEATGALEGLKAALNLRESASQSIFICLDNLAAAKCLRGTPSDSSQDVFLEFQALAASHGSTQVRWIPGHTDIPGNERADKLAKAASLLPEPEGTRPTLAHL